MANYNAPQNPDSEYFNIDNFVADNEYFDFDTRYLLKTGDTGNNSYYWNGSNSYNNTSNHFKESRYYDTNSNIMLYLKPTGEILCEQINGISKLRLTYLLTMDSDIQTQVNDILSNIALKASIIYVDQQDDLLQDDIDIINNTTIPAVDAKTVSNLNSINTINNTTIPTVDSKTVTNLNSINTITSTTIPASTSTAKAYTDTQNDLIAFPNNTTFTGTTIINKIELPSDTVDKECLMYYDNTNDCTMINSIHHGVNGKPICLNTVYGGDIIIGSNSKLILGDEIDFSYAAITNFNKSDINLQNVTNETKTTMFTNPTFTGTTYGITQSMIGLSNVTNESKATMFTEPHFAGHTEIDEVGIGNIVYQNGWVLPIVRARISLNSDGAVITPIHVINIGTRTYLSKGYYRFFFETAPFGIAPPDVNYEVNCVGNYQGDVGYNGIMAYNISNLTVSSFDIKQYRLGLSGSAENHDPGGFTSIPVLW